MNTQQKLKSPPYSKGRLGADVRVYFGSGDTWGMAKWTNEHTLTRALVMPTGEDPAAYRWPVRGLEVVAIQRGEAPPGYDRKLADALLRDGARMMVVCGLAPDKRIEMNIYAQDAAQKKESPSNRLGLPKHTRESEI